MIKILALLCTTSAEVKIDAMAHDVQEITKLNFDGVIGKFRDSTVSSLFLFDSSVSMNTFDTYNSVATSMKGMVKVTALDCDRSAEAKTFCKAEAPEGIPAIRIYPQNPIPAYTYTGTPEKLQRHLSKRIPDMSKVLIDETFDSWITTDASKPKVVLFSDKESAPTILKALSSEVVFKRTVNTGFVSSKNEKTHAKFVKSRKLPAVLVVRGAKAEIKEWYDGPLTYDGLKTWINSFSESGMGDSLHGSSGNATVEESKPWLVAEIPELTGKSHQDVCFKGEGLCVIYLNKGNVLDDSALDMLTALKMKFTSNLADRGAKWKWMWVDLELEKAFSELLGNPALPGVVVFNPHKRLRWTKSEDGAATESTINSLLDKIMGGDARFTVVKGQKLPSWAVRDARKKDEL